LATKAKTSNPLPVYHYCKNQLTEGKFEKKIGHGKHSLVYFEVIYKLLVGIFFGGS